MKFDTRPLSLSHPKADFHLDDFAVRYTLRQSTVELSLWPASKHGDVVARRLSGPVHPELSRMKFLESGNDSVDPLVQVAVRSASAHGLWTAGGTMRNSAATESLRFERQEVVVECESCRIVTTLVSSLGFEVVHTLIWEAGDPGVRIETTICNTGEGPLPVEMLSSFSLTGISPFVEDDASGRLKLHRFRSAWSNEAMHTVQDFESMHLERSWAGGPVHLRYGQAGSLPVRQFHPCVGIEDAGAGVLWGACIAWHGSWQMEVYRRDDPVAISGGLGDYELAHWMKTLGPGESLTAPTALVAVCQGDVDCLGGRLVEMQKHLAYEEPAHEADLPIIFNEWCSSWGHPTHDYLLRTADRLSQTQTKYLVIDDGWAEKPADADIQFNGDWNVSEKAFPDGLKATTAAIRERGLIPGIWFEFEPCTEGTNAFGMTDHQLHRHGQVLQVGNRHFWDFRDPWTFEYLTRKVIDLLRDNDFGYLKVDYNDSIGLGCDGAESLGEGLRQHLIKVKEFFALIRTAVPGIVIENCASGGHRLEPGMVGLTSMSSFSDAHETVEIPMIAASLHRLIPVHKNQIWAVLRPDDSPQRLCYSLVATFLGRMCISGDLVDLPEAQFKLLVKAQEFYQKNIDCLRSGRSHLLSHAGKSRRNPTGWQALLRESTTGGALLVVVHCFALPEGLEALKIPLPEGSKWRMEAEFNAGGRAKLLDGQLRIDGAESFTGLAVRLVPESPQPA